MWVSVSRWCMIVCVS
uniref:Uncharacterized protein n=1 Tax=Arundo donax TaxID=35708 RepID=A0A0A9B538_ARUDO